MDTAIDTKDTRDTAGTTVNKAPHRYSYGHQGHQGTAGTMVTKAPYRYSYRHQRTTEELQALWSPKHLTGHQRHCGHYCHQSIPNRYSCRYLRHQRYCGHYCHQSTLQIQLQTPRIPAALQALLSLTNLTKTVRDTRH